MLTIRGSKTDLKNIELIKQLVALRDHIDVDRIIGLNVDSIEASDISHALVGYMQKTTLEAIAMHICRIYESSRRNDLNSITGIIRTLPMGPPSTLQREALTQFGARYGNVASPDEVQGFLSETFRAFSAQHEASLSRLKQYRDEIGAHNDYKATRDALPSHEEFENLYQFALDFYCLVARSFLDVTPAIVHGYAGRGLIRTLKSLGVEEPLFQFPA
jgi:hypothetical protein